MQAKRFVAQDMRRALEMVKREFGEDALILTTERSAKGVELVATVEAALPMQDPIKQEAPPATVEDQIREAASRFQAAPHPVKTHQSVTTSSPEQRGLASGKTPSELAEEIALASRKMEAARKMDNMTLEEWADQHSKQNTNTEPDTRFIQEFDQISEPIRAQKNTVTADEDIRRLHDEIISMRDTLEEQLSTLADAQERYLQSPQPVQQAQQNAPMQSYDLPQAVDRPQRENQQWENQPSPQTVNKSNIHPVAFDLKERLSTLGLSQTCYDNLLSQLQPNRLRNQDPQFVWTKALAGLARQIPSDISDPVASGGVYAFLGATGVGKTTTIAKLAARYVMQYGAEQVVLVSTDNFRIASHNQLQSLAEILSVRIEMVEELAQLPSVVNRLSSYSLVLIDTPGLVHGDPLLKLHMQAMSRCRGLQSMVVLAANSQYPLMKASLHSYRQANPSYCVLTKLDECIHLGDALSVLSEHTLPLAYVTDGQSVPDDLSILKPAQLVSRAVKLCKSFQASFQRTTILNNEVR